MYKVEIKILFPDLHKDLSKVVDIARVPVKGDMIRISADESTTSVPAVDSVTLELNPENDQPVALVEVSNQGPFSQSFYDKLTMVGWKK